MKRKLQILIFVLFQISTLVTAAQCSICTKTAQQLGEQPAKGMNAGIIYLALTPFVLAGYIYYRWKKSNKIN
ncbi:MAG: hypothetical protein EPO57_07085 [Chitinophagaceae bacterium]|nr:MAG: hypothetical protein EPO57_07085 [Chitinophagaceae bacterium]